MNVLVLLPLTPAQRTRLTEAAPDATIVYATPDASGTGMGLDGLEITPQLLVQADVIIGNIEPSRLSDTRHLKLLQLNSAGYDAYLAPGAVPAGARLANARGAYGQAVSEHMLASTLALMKHLPGYVRAQQAHTWTDLGPVTSLAGARVLVLGAGDIGSHVARLASALGATVTGVRRRALGAAEALPAGFDAIRSIDELYDQLPKADVIAACLPSTPATRGLADARFFAACKTDALFVNAGRGDLVDYDALAAALRLGPLAGAALDVTAPEPLPAESPLWDIPNLLITPHISGGFHLPATLDRIVDIAADNLRRLSAGEPLRNVVATGR